MERPVQDVDMGTEAALKFLIKLIDDVSLSICLLYTSQADNHRADNTDKQIQRVDARQGI